VIITSIPGLPDRRGQEAVQDARGLHRPRVALHPRQVVRGQRRRLARRALQEPILRISISAEKNPDEF
jgi:hypothetical protein